MHQIGQHTFLSSPELAARLGVSPRTVNDWANKNHPAASWDNYSHQWEWDLEKYLAWKLTRRERPAKDTEPHPASSVDYAGANAKTKPGRKPKFKVVR